MTLVEVATQLADACSAFEAWILKSPVLQGTLEGCFLFQGVVDRLTLLEKSPETPFTEQGLMKWLESQFGQGDNWWGRNVEKTVTMIAAARPMVCARLTVFQTAISARELFDLEDALAKLGHEHKPKDIHGPDTLAIWFAKNGYQYRP